MKTRSAWTRLRLATFALLALGAGEAWGVYNCFVTATSTATLWASNNTDDVSGMVTLNCSRTADDPNSLTYYISADNGLDPNGTQRRVKLGTGNDYLDYALRSGTCGQNSNWFDPDNVITGTLNFGVALNASATLPYCIRITQPGGAPAAGIYTDIVTVSAHYPVSDGDPLTGRSDAFLNYTVGVNAQCVFNTFPSAMVFNYTSFSPTPQNASQDFVLRCSKDLPWSVSVSDPESSMLGLNYSIAASPDSGTGNGNTGQTVTLTGTIPAGQAGTCASGTCTAAHPHTVTISY